MKKIALLLLVLSLLLSSVAGIAEEIAPASLDATELFTRLEVLFAPENGKMCLAAVVLSDGPVDIIGYTSLQIREIQSDGSYRVAAYAYGSYDFDASSHFCEISCDRDPSKTYVAYVAVYLERGDLIESESFVFNEP